MMNKLIAVTAIAAALTAGLAADANAWERKTKIFGPRGTSKVHVHGDCYGGTCTRQVTRKGPYGGTMTRQGEVSCAGGTCYGSRVTTGPRGNTVYREGSISRY
jgi:type 1 fimbria pilin